MEWAFLYSFLQKAKDQIFILQKHSSQLSAYLTPSFLIFLQLWFGGKSHPWFSPLFSPALKFLCIGSLRRPLYLGYIITQTAFDSVWRSMLALESNLWCICVYHKEDSYIKQKVEPIWPHCKAKSFICVWEGLCEQASSDCPPLWVGNPFLALPAFQVIPL